jgi:hypothetical protein
MEKHCTELHHAAPSCTELHKIFQTFCKKELTRFAAEGTEDQGRGTKDSRHVG